MKRMTRLSLNERWFKLNSPLGTMAESKPLQKEWEDCTRVSNVPLCLATVNYLFLPCLFFPNQEQKGKVEALRSSDFTKLWGITASLLPALLSNINWGTDLWHQHPCPSSMSLGHFEGLHGSVSVGIFLIHPNVLEDAHILLFSDGAMRYKEIKLLFYLW